MKHETIMPAYDYTVDLDDVWIEETDPENVLGECCTGLFTINEADADLVGLICEDNQGKWVHSREQAIIILSWDTVRRVERVAFEQWGEQQ